MDFTIKPALEKLNNKIETTKNQLNEKFETQDLLIKNSLVSIKSDIGKEINERLTAFNKLNTDFLAKSNQIDKIKTDLDNQYNRMRLDLKENQDYQNREFASKCELLFNAVSASEKNLKSTFNLFKVSLRDSKDASEISVTDFNAKKHQLVIKKLKPDNRSITFNDAGDLSWNYSFDNRSLKVDDNKSVYASALYLGDGKYLRANDINNDLNNATYNIDSITYKLEKILAKLNTVKGYVASNNFNTEHPDETALTNFVLSCLSTVSDQIKPADLAAGTKVKNTFNNHIWILNKIKGSDGLTQLKWEDFGSDNICIAGNNGIHGLVSGSQERLKGYVDVRGVISINGLEEDLTNMTESILEIKNDLTEYKLTVEARLNELESKLMNLTN